MSYKFAIADLTNQKLRRDLGGSDFTLPKQQQRGKLRLALRFSEEVAGVHIEKHPTVREIRATVGQVDLRPEAGMITFEVDGEETAELAYDFEASDFQTALRATTAGAAAVVVEDDDSFLVTGVTEAITRAQNTLRPISFVRKSTYEVNGTTTQAFRLQRAPFGFTDQFTQKVPAGPSITRVEAGGTEGTIEWPEIQKLSTPRDFAGSYRLLTDDEIQRSPLLGIGDGPEQVQAAINPDSSAETLGLATDADGEFVVTEHPTEPAMFIEFRGSMLGIAQDLLKVRVFDAPAGDFYLTIDLDTAATAEAFRDVDEITVPLEILADFEDEDDSEVVHTDIPVFYGSITIVESVNHDDLGTPSNQDFLEPPAAKTYLPVSPDSLTSGVRFYEFLLGDGSDTGPFAVAHNLSSPRTKVSLRENKADGASLVEGTDFSVVFGDDDQLTITILGDYASDALTSNELSGTVMDLTSTSTWLAHTHTIAEVTGLQTILDAMAEDIAALQASAAGSGITSLPVEGGYSRRRAIPAFGEVYPQLGRNLLEVAEFQRIANLDTSLLPRVAGRLFPALHVSSTESLPVAVSGSRQKTVAADSSYAGKVYKNLTGEDVRIPIGTGWILPANGFAACDGRAWYPVEQYGSSEETTYYPAHLVRQLWIETIEDTELLAGRKFIKRFALSIAALESTSPIYTHVVIEVADLTQDTTPATTGGNIAEDAWAAAPVLSQRLTLTGSPIEAIFGYRVIRDSAGDLTADAFVSGKWISTTAPTSARFAVRARLTRFDTVNSVDDVTGFIAYSGPVFQDGETAGISDEVGFSIVQ